MTTLPNVPTDNLLGLPVAAPMPPATGYGYTPPTHEKAGLVHMIRNNPGATAFIFGVLILITILLAFKLVECKRKKRSGFEGLATEQQSPCPPGYTVRTSGNSQYCVPANNMPDLKHNACKQSWDPAASAEAQALATVGSYQHDQYGERSLQHAINAAYDRNVPLNEVQLNEFLHQGGSP